MFLNDYILKISDIKHLSCFQKREEVADNFLDRYQEEQIIICLGYHEKIYHLAKPWLKEQKKLYFLEIDPRVYLKLEKSLLKDPHVQFLSTNEEEIKNLVWSAFGKKIYFVCHPELETDPTLAYVKTLIENYSLARDVVISDVADLGIACFKNITHNLTHFSFKKGVGLKNTFKDVPAIICGAGPSIEGQFQKIKQIKDKALVFAGGTALRLFKENQIEPHFGAGVDKKAFLRTFKQDFSCLYPFFLQSRIAKENLPFLAHELICLGESEKAFLSSYLKQHLSLDPFSGGWCVGNFLTHIALFLGCNPLILVGMDFSYSEGKKYADEQIVSNKVVFQKDFLLAKKYQDKLKKQYSDREFLSLSKETTRALNSCKQQEDLEGRIHQAIQNCDILLKNHEAFTDLIKSLHVCQAYLHECSFLEEERLKEEIAYKYLLLPLWTVFHPVILGEIGMKETNLEKKRHQYVFFLKVIELYIKEIH